MSRRIRFAMFVSSGLLASACGGGSTFVLDDYSAMALTPGRDHRPCTVDIDRDADGSPDERLHYAYELDRVMSSVLVDEDLDGVPERTLRYHYRGGARRIQEVRVGAGPGDEAITYAWDDQGRLVESRHDRDADGKPEEVRLYAHDDDGRIIRAERWDRTRDDDRPAVTVTYTYDPSGRVTRLEQRDRNGTVTARTTYGYGADALRRVEQIDLDADGTIDRVRTFHFDGNARLLMIQDDRDNDRKVDVIIRYTWDDRHRPISVSIDRNADGAPDEIKTFAYGCLDETIDPVEP